MDHDDPYHTERDQIPLRVYYSNRQTQLYKMRGSNSYLHSQTIPPKDAPSSLGDTTLHDSQYKQDSQCYK
jgi:hypothetical protein